MTAFLSKIPTYRQSRLVRPSYRQSRLARPRNVWWTISLICGILFSWAFLSTCIDSSTDVWSQGERCISGLIWGGFGMMIVMVVSLFLTNRKDSVNGFAFAWNLLIFSVGMIIYALTFNKIAFANLDSTENISGTIIENPIKKTKSVAVKIKTDEGARILAYLKDSGNTVSTDSVDYLGRRITMKTPYGLDPTCPWENEGNPYKYYSDYLFRQGVSATCYSPEDCWEINDDEAQKKSWLQIMRGLQRRMSASLKNAGIDGDEGAIIEAMTLGNKAALDDSIRQNYSRAGVSHVLALSGLHLTIIYGIMQLILPFCFLTIVGRRRLNLLVMLGIWAFTIIAGCPPSLVRASIMCSIMIVCDLLDRRGNLLNSLSLAAFVMLLIRPMWLMDVGFQLSFMSMLGIAIGLPFIHRYVSLKQLSKQHTIWSRSLKWIISMVMTSTVCGLFTMPLVGYYFGCVPLLSVFSNLIICALTTLLLWITALWWLISFVPILSKIVASMMIGTAWTMNQVAAWIGGLDFAVLYWQPSIIAVVLSYTLLIIIMHLVHKLLDHKMY